MTAPVSVRGLTKRFDEVTALTEITLDIDAGEFIVLLGPSGCGKTTLLSILGGFLTPSAGTVHIGETDVTHVPAARRPTTTVFQDYALFPHMTLAENVGFGPRMQGVGSRDRRRKADALLDLVGLTGFADRKPHELSGGQRQRVALARALAVDPEVLLLDEPLGALDLKLRRQMQDELKAIQRRVGTTFVHVTHDQEEAMAIADRIVVMNQGRIEDVGQPEAVYMRPRSLFAAGFMGEINFLRGRVATRQGDACSVDAAFGTVTVPGTAFPARMPEPGDTIVLCIRPEHVEVKAGDDSRPGLMDLGEATVTDSAFFGTHYRCHLMLAHRRDASPFVAHLPQSSSLRSGATIGVRVDSSRVIALPCDD